MVTEKDQPFRDEYVQLDATAQAELVRRGEVQPTELVEAAIARIEHLNPKLNAVITPLFEQALAQAASPQLPAGPFRGVPLLLKDFFCETKGDPYYAGMRFLRDYWSREGLPIGVQLVADYGREDILIRIAAQLEQAHPWSERWPLTHA